MRGEQRTPEQWDAKRARGQREYQEQQETYKTAYLHGKTPFEAELQRTARRRASANGGS
jgi:hypothetical protein